MTLALSVQRFHLVVMVKTQRCISVAPEVISGTPQYDGKLADVWSCGVLLMTMLFHQYPFERPNDPKGPIAYKLVTYPPLQLLSTSLYIFWKQRAQQALSLENDPTLLPTLIFLV